MTYSEISITFLQEFEPDVALNNMSIGYEVNGFAESVLMEKIVTTRSAANEFSVGTDATTQAQNYKDALDLDYLASGDFEFEIVGATVTVKATDLNVQFYRSFLLLGEPNISRIDFTITNFSNPITPTDGILFARSNFYLSSEITTEIYKDVDMYFRTGDLTLPLTTADYEKRVVKPSTNWEYFDVLFSRFALDFIEPKPVYQASNGALNSSVNSLVCTTVRSRSDLQVEWQEEYKDLITTRGYSSYLDGANYLYSGSEILLSSLTNQVLKDGIIMVPYLNDGSITEIVIKNDADTVVYTHTLTTEDTAESKLQYLFFNTGGIESTYFEVANTYIFEVVEECRYTPVNVLFLNQFGVFENLTFFKARNETTNFEQEGEYKNNFVVNGAFDTSRHLYRSGNKNARTSITLNTGYINEDQNKSIENLLNSEYVYFNDNGTFTPVNVDKKSLEKLTGLNDNLINYSIDFKYSFDLVQTV